MKKNICNCKDENFNENIGTFKLMPVFNNKYVKKKIIILE